MQLCTEEHAGPGVSSLHRISGWLGIDVWVGTVLSEDRGRVQRQMLAQFSDGAIETNDGRPLLRFVLSVRILDEAVDLPSCDSVFFAAPSRSKVRSIQRAARAMRNERVGKMAHVFLWCDASCDEQAGLLSALRERDARFSEKVRGRACPLASTQATKKTSLM